MTNTTEIKSIVRDYYNKYTSTNWATQKNKEDSNFLD